MRRILTFLSRSLPLAPHMRSRSIVDFNSDNVARQNYWLKHAKLYFNFKTTSMSNKTEYLIDCWQSAFLLNPSSSQPNPVPRVLSYSSPGAEVG